MKHLKIAVIALFALVTVSNVTAQDSNNPWVVGIGINAVDIRGNRNFGDIVKDGLGTSDWNVLPSISRISAEKYITKGFTMQLAGSLNKIETFLSKDDSDFLYYAIDANVKYDMDPVVNMIFGGTTQYFDPFVYVGAGYTSMDSNGDLTANMGAGFNTWFNENLGVNFTTGAKHGFGDNVRGHFQHSAGIVFRFGGKDTDGDGVQDKEDACPEVAGLKSFNGCPDADGDGVKDADDACPQVAGLAAFNGCPDTDGDGVADKNDMCINVKGSKANRGCPDADGDGVVDKDDKCVNQAGPAANAGCPWPDTDGDGVLDKDDKCVTVKGVASNNGCPAKVISEVAKASLSKYAQTINFNSGRTSFKSGVTKKLNAIVDIMNQHSKANFSVEGYTDSSGRASSNLKLSSRRANAVMNYLIKKGINASRLSAKGFGVANPIATNKTRAGKALNRRVEIKVTN